ncbi:diapophytoene dehydrogenase [Parabacteroides goldsteinii]|uniref:Dihydrolipoamide acetyltransferase component of pyruvate dehydrogenase complex n=1 Tax=Parabacteroides goldsteinii TaxID=328812 RepID=A0A0J6CH80_9BACT|nr:dihydrolipoamide acetyltransferase family protein [Parabacteroides goldsteinii]KMM31494.1 diapophytoene dehydrogenase [Parabacteroides goldsteinii]
MATFEIKMPKLGESITEGTIISWSVKTGDSINEDDVLFEVSTAKVSAEIPSPVAGKVLEILFQEGDTVAVGTTVAIIGLEGSEDDTDNDTAVHTDIPEKESAETPTNDKNVPSATPVPKAQAAKEDERWYSPVVLQMARDANLSQDELDRIPGTGYMGRLSKKDMKDYLSGKKDATTKTQSQPASQTVTESKPAPASQTKPAQTSPASSAPASQVISSAPVSAGSEDKVMEMDRVGKIIADHMVMSKNVSPHVTTVVEVDVTKLVQWRSRNKETFRKREGVSLTYMPAITEATAKALSEFPQVNASVNGYQIILKKHINVGIAVSLDDGNLIVPVVRDADKLNLNGLAVAIDTLANKARDNKLAPDDIQGGTFTITNFGTFKNLFATPIINQPQVAILGVGYIEKKPAVIETPEGDTIGIRHKMYLSLSYDHRLINGALGGAFLRRIADYLENWSL